MPARMTSRERMIAALRRQDVDYVPCCPTFSPSLVGPEHTWKGRADGLEQIVNSLGLDACVRFSLEPSRHPDVTESVWKESVPGERWPIVHKRFDTPAGPLTAAIRLTDDMPQREDVLIYDDWNVSRFVEPWFKTDADLDRFQYLHLPPTDADIVQARERFLAAKALADRYQVITYATVGKGLTGTLQLWGATQAILVSMDRPDLMERYLEIEHRSNMRMAEVLSGWGVDVMRRNGFYETTDHWSPAQLRRFVVPQVKEEIAAMRSGGAVTAYTVETGIMPILDILADLEFDAYDAIEPALGHQDMKVVAAKLGDRHAFWGGVSGPIHIGEGTPEIARQAVRDAFDTFGRRGLVLNAVPSIRAHWPWENALAMFDEWRRLR